MVSLNVSLRVMNNLGSILVLTALLYVEVLAN